jgi:hypothetical protein
MVAVDTPAERKELDGYHVIVTNKERPGVAAATYALSSVVEADPDDIIILASDDFYPPDDWDTWVVKTLKGKVACLLIRDGYQQGGCVTLPIMTHSCLLKLNRIIYHPHYHHRS